MNHVIVGSGIAGLTAAETIRAHDAKAVISMVSDEAHDYYSRPGLAYYLRGDVSEKQLFIRNKQDILAANVKRVLARAVGVAVDRHHLLLEGNKILPYDRLLIATGALAVPAAFPGGDLAGIVKLDGLDDTRHILKLARKRQPAVVVGGGITALELAEGLNACGMRVQYFLRGDRYWGDVLDADESKIIMDRLRHEGIKLRLNTQIKQAIGTKGKVTAVETQAGEMVPCEVLGVAIGVKPRLELAKAAGLTIDKAIVVDAFMRTSAADVYAAGDVAQVGKMPLDVLWPTAIDHGKVAGANMAGDHQQYVKGVACNVTMLSGLKVTIIGAVGSKSGKPDPDLLAISRGDSEAWRVHPAARVVANHDTINRIRIFVGERTIIGALVMGDQSWSKPLQHLIAGQADISSVRAKLLDDPGLKLLAEFYHQWERSRLAAGRKLG